MSKYGPCLFIGVCCKCKRETSSRYLKKFDEYKKFIDGNLICIACDQLRRIKRK